MLDSMAFELAYRQYAGRLTGLSRRVTNGSADAEDVAQDAWIEAWKARDTIDVTRMWAWLCRVVRRLWWKRLHPLKSDAKREALPEHVEFTPEAHDAVEAPAQEQVAEAAVLHKAIDELTVPWIASNGKPYERAMSTTAKTTMHMYARLGSKVEVARLRDMRESNVTNVVNRAIAALRMRWGLQ